MGSLKLPFLLGVALIVSALSVPPLYALESKEAPSFTLPDQDGRSVILDHLRGKIIVLEWINPGCPFVKRHYKKGTMKGLAEKYASRGVIWLAINSTRSMSDEEDQDWKADHALPYDILNDKEGITGKAYGAKTTPTMVVIDQKGMIAYQGAIDDDPEGEKEAPLNYVAKALDELLAGKPVSIAETASYGCSVKYKA